MIFSSLALFGAALPGNKVPAQIPGPLEPIHIRIAKDMPILLYFLIPEA